METAKKLLCKGCPTYLAHVVDVDKLSSKIKEVLVVQEYLDVFSEDRLRLPPEWEIEFLVDLKPSTQPISQPL